MSMCQGHLRQKFIARIGISDAQCYIGKQLVVGGFYGSGQCNRERTMVIRRKQSESSNLPNSPIRRRFAAWSLAVVGAISSSGMVCLQPSAAWGIDDTAAEKKDDEAKESESEGVLNREVFSKLLTADKLDEAAEKLDAALAATPESSELLSMEVQLASYLSRSNPAESKRRLAELTPKLLAKKELDVRTAGTLIQVTSMRVQLDRELKYEEKLTIVDAAIAKLNEALGDRAPSMTRSLVQNKVRLMVEADRADEAKSLLDSLVADARSAIDPEKPSTLSAFGSIATLYNTSLKSKYPEESKAIVDEADKNFLARIADEQATPQDFGGYISMKLSMTSGLTYSDPRLGLANIAEIEKAIETAKERFEEKELQPLAMFDRSVQSLKRQLETAMAREELIGTQAPPIQAKYFVGTDPVTMEDLQGKVVLLDFWAVWCGPCIATFPHLIEWHEKFADKGLVILGSTNFYNYKWDEEGGKAVSSKDEPVAPKDELVMLEKFRESYKLHHGFFVNPKGSTYAASFAVSGIPQAVLLDKQGKIQLIRVGSGEANAKAIEAKIEELLAQ